ncbi:MAG TPA: FecR domain-containing protein [Chryseolinea sp.]|nr:FecR domain-containing protein [Chryseolinea sp.]
MSNIEINDDLIVRYLTGDAGPEEAMVVTDWLNVPENRAHYDQFEATWRQSGGVQQPRYGKADAWNIVSASVSIPAESVRSPRTHSFWPMGIAAAVVALALSAYFVFHASTTAPQPAMGIAATSDGFRYVELSDRSTVTLHRNSELQYPDQFDSERRLVRLTRGQAFFNVTGDAGRPFVVEVDDVVIKVLGTEFNVLLRDSVMTIHVREGRVLVTSPVDSVTLTTGLTGRVRGGNISVTDIPAGNLYSYATQRLVFNDAPLDQVIRDLEDSYPYTFELKSKSLENCRLTANFYKDDIDKIVNLVAETLNLTVIKNGRQFTIEGEGCL